MFLARRTTSARTANVLSTAARWVTAGVLAVAVVGCAADKKDAFPKDLPQTSGTLNPPLVLSGSPSRDTAAYRSSEQSLAGAGWKSLEDKGPKPTKYGKIVDGTDGKKGGDFGVGDVAPSTAPSAASTTQPVFDESELPLQQINLSDGKVRLIWTLRNYGGQTVTTSRDGGTSRRNVALAQPDLAPLVAALTQQVPGGTVAPLPNVNTLIITCDAAQRQSVVELLARLDVPPRQVEITAKIFEVSHDFDFQVGARVLAKHIGANGTQTGASTFDTQRFLNTVQNPAGGPYQGSVIGLMQASKDAGISLEASFQALAEEGLIKVVSSPRMTVAVGQTGTLLAGQEIPIQSASIVNNALQATTTYKPVGVQLYITPQAVGPNRVKLHTISIVSSLSGFTPLPTIQGGGTSFSSLIVNPIIDTREAETAVTVEDGNTLVISGLRMVRQITRENKVPGLGDIPLLGMLFKNQRTQQQQTDLYFFVTPTLL